MAFRLRSCPKDGKNEFPLGINFIMPTGNGIDKSQHMDNQMCTELTAEQRVAMQLCDEWLKEVGLPLYSELVKQKAEVPTAPTVSPELV